MIGQWELKKDEPAISSIGIDANAHVRKIYRQK